MDDVKISKQCPKCCSENDVIPILYGMPGPDMVIEEEAGKIKLGGCLICDENPQWFCKKCDIKFCNDNTIILNQKSQRFFSGR
jgi:hypothetical protein